MTDKYTIALEVMDKFEKDKWHEAVRELCKVKNCPGLEPLVLEVLIRTPPDPETPDPVEQPEPPAPPTPNLGILGDFRLVREIGRGGMGVVYEAVQISLNRPVALKTLPFAMGLNARQFQRFKIEAQAAARLHHTNIVPVYASGNDRGVHFYAMQLIAGQTLAAVIEDMRGRTPRAEPSGAGSESKAEAAGVPTADTRPSLGAQLSTQRSDRPHEFFRTVVRLTLQVAEALDYAHEMGIIHRDIKPANLLIDERGNVWVTDFGLAQFHDEPGLTQTGDIVGTLRYMSPEQAGGPRTLIDRRTDVYSLGATLYELLTLRTIFDGKDRQTLLHQILYHEPRPLRSIDPSIPEDLEILVGKAIEKIPNERFATAQDLADELRRFLQNKPIITKRPSRWRRTKKWAQRHPAVVISAGVCMFAFVLALAGSICWIWADRVAQQGHLEQAGWQALEEVENSYRHDKLPEALARLNQAEGLMNSGGRSEELWQRVRQWQAVLKLILKFEDIRIYKEDDSYKIDTNYALAEELSTHGIKVDATPIQAVVDWICAKPEPVRVQLVALFDYLAIERKQQHPHGADWRWPLQVALAADNDPWRNKVRTIIVQEQLDRVNRLKELAKSADHSSLPAQSSQLIGQALAEAGDLQGAVAFLRDAQRYHFGDVWLNLDLATLLRRLKQIDDAIRYCQAAVAVRPGMAHRLAHLLSENGKKHEAIAVLQVLIKTEPEDARHRYCLDGIKRYIPPMDPGVPPIARPPIVAGSPPKPFIPNIISPPPGPPTNVPFELGGLGDSLPMNSKSALEFKKACEVVDHDPNNPMAHYEVALVLLKARCNSDMTIKYLEKAVELDPNLAMGHCLLGYVLPYKGQFKRALEESQLGHNQGSKLKHWSYKSQQQISNCERLLELDEKLRDILSGKRSLSKATEVVEYARFAHHYKAWYADAVRLWERAFTIAPKLADDLRHTYLYDAARAAALAACAEGKESPVLNDNDRARLRGKALVWLREDLAAWSKQLKNEELPLSAAAGLWADFELHYQRAYADFKCFRDEPDLARIPERERDAWRSLWRDVQTLLTQHSKERQRSLFGLRPKGA